MPTLKRLNPNAQRPTPENGAAPNYAYPDTESPLRPDAGTQSQFKKKKPPTPFRYDASLDPQMQWDGQNPARQEGEELLRQISEATTLEEAKAAAEKLAAMSKPFLNWAGKAERLSFEVPTLPLFTQERLSTAAIIETLRGHKPQLDMLADLYGDPQRPIADQILRAYEHRAPWVNRLILGDSLIVMNSLLQYEAMAGQVQMIYMDPPYGVKFGSNFQPFVRKRDVTHNDDDSMTREPEMVQAYRDTWELGLHSYLTYLRDRLLLSRELLTPSGSIFVQISDENVHHVREVMDEVFGAENFVSQIFFQTTTGFETRTLPTLGDFLLWYAKDKEVAQISGIHKLYEKQSITPGGTNAAWILLPDGSYRGVTAAEARRETPLPEGARLYNPDNFQSQGPAREPQPFDYEGKTYLPGANSHWKANYPVGMQRLADAGRIHVAKNSLRYRRFADDFPYKERGNIWTDTLTGSFTDDKVYVVQTNVKVLERCILLTTKPGDIVLDPTCGSGTTAYVAEKWGRRWITIDTSRVPLALTRQRLLTAVFPYFALNDSARGPIGGFVYERKRNQKGDEIGGIVPRVRLENIANDAPPDDVVLVDKPEEIVGEARVCGAFAVEAVIPPAQDLNVPPPTTDDAATYTARMLEVLRRSPVLRLPGNETVAFRNVRLPARSLNLSAEAVVDASAPGQNPSLADIADEAEEKNGARLALSEKPVAFVFGPEDGAVSEKTVFDALKEANLRGYTHLYVLGFAIEPNARMLIENGADVAGIPATYAQATTDLTMGDLLKNMRSSQIFSVCGLPDIKIHAHKDGLFSVELLGLDVFDPATMEVHHEKGDNVPAWFLDSDYNELCFRVSQAFFPRTAAWDNLKKALKGDYDSSVWDHLSGSRSAPFAPGDRRRIAVKVIDDRGNELLVVKPLPGANK